MAESGREDGDKQTAGTNSKVGRVIAEYGLTGLGDELVALWSDEGDNQRSLRELAEYVNHELLRSAMENAGMSPLEGEVENTYRLLTDDDVSSGMRTQAETALEREGVDVERLRTDFVSHQAVHTYLTKFRGVETPGTTDEGDQVDKTVDAIQRLKNRLAAVTADNLRTLRETDRIMLGEFNVLVDVRVFCEDCQTRYDVVELLRSGGCDCGQEG
jgi:hypothetical protein